MSLTVGSLFSGIGGLDLGLERAGMTIRWQVENDDHCSRVLARHWPDVPRYGDIKELAPDDLEPVDLICGGFPCQPVSATGRRRGQEDERWLWPEMCRVLRHLGPTWVLIENVPGLRTLGLDLVRCDLDALGYRSRPVSLSACEFGAPHSRTRLFVVGHAEGFGCASWWAQYADQAATGQGWEEADQQPERPGWWAIEPRVDRVAYGVPSGVERRRAIGNAVVPQVAEYIGRRIMAAATRAA